MVIDLHSCYKVSREASRITKIEAQEAMAGLVFVLLQVMLMLCFSFLIQLGPGNWGALT